MSATQPDAGLRVGMLIAEYLIDASTASYPPLSLSDRARMPGGEDRYERVAEILFTLARTDPDHALKTLTLLRRALDGDDHAETLGEDFLAVRCATCHVLLGRAGFVIGGRSYCDDRCAEVAPA